MFENAPTQNTRRVLAPPFHFHGPDEKQGLDVPCGDWFVAWGFKTPFGLLARPMRFYPNAIHEQCAFHHQSNNMDAIG